MSINKFGKKALTSAVVTSTILWSMGASMLVAPLTAVAAAADGSLIKAKEFETVYYLKSGKRYTFPNLKTFKTWFKDFSSVTTVPLSELQSYPLSGNVVYRPGTHLVKITTDPKVYAVEPSGKLRWVKSEDVAKSLWGTNWAKSVDDVADAFFTNYSIGSDIDTAVYPNGALVKMGTSYYYIQDGKKRAVASDALTGNNFNTAYAVTVADLSAYADGTAFGTSETSDVAQGATAGQTTTPTTGGTGSLTIAAASDTPMTGSIVVDTTSDTGGQRRAMMLKFNVTATGGDAKVTQVQAKRTGVSKDGDVDQLYLADANGNILAKNTSLATGVATFSSSVGLFTVPSGTTVTLWILEDVNKSSASGSTQGWTVESAGVKLGGSGSASGTATGGLLTVATVTDLGQVEFATSTPLSATTVDAGKTDYTLGTFKFKAMDQEILLKKVKFTQIGSIANNDLQNLKLKVAGTQYDGVKATMDNNSLTFDLTKDSAGAAVTDGGLKILAGQTKFLDIIGDVIGGTNRNFKFSVQNEEDVTALDNGYKVYVGVKEWSTDSFSVQTLAATTINTGTLTVSLAATSPNTNVAAGASSVLLAKFNLTAAGEDEKVTALTVFGTSGDTTTVLKNVKLLLDGVQVGTTVASSTAQGDNTSTDAEFTFTNNFIVRVATASTLEVYADLTDSTVAANDTLSVTLRAGSSNAQGLVSLTNVSTAAVTSNTVTVKTGAPSVLLNNSMSDGSTTAPTGVLNDSDVKIGSFIIQGGAGEGSKVTSLTIGDHASALTNFFNRLRVQHNGVNLAVEVGTLSAASSTYAFTFTSPVTVQKGEQYVVDVVANILSTTGAAALDAAAQAVVKVTANGMNYQTLETGQSGTAPSSAVTGQKVYIANKGTLTAAVAADTAVTQQLIMGAVDQSVFKVKLTAGNSEDVKITELVTAATIVASAVSPTGILKDIKLWDGTTQLGSTIAALNTSDATTTSATSTAYAKFSSLNIVVPKGTSKTLTITSSISATPNELSNTRFTMYLVNGYDTTAGASASKAIVANGSKSGSAITTSGVDGVFSSATVRGNMLFALRTKLSVAHASNAPSGASSASTGQAVAKFVVSNTANTNGAAATVNLVNVDIATSISLHASTARSVTMYKTETLTSDNVVATASSLNSAAQYATCEPGTATYNSTSCPVWATGQFTAQTIEANSSQTFTVTLDTTDATSNKTLTVGIPSSFITWSDGYTAGITRVDSLPLTGKTLTY